MPIYYGPAGHRCTADEAISFGRLNPGYREVLADGEHARMSLLMRDSASNLTTDEAAFRDSAEGQTVIAYAKSRFNLAISHPSHSGQNWTPAMADAAIRDHLGPSQTADPGLVAAQTAADAAYQRGIDGLNAWRNR